MTELTPERLAEIQQLPEEVQALFSPAPDLLPRKIKLSDSSNEKSPVCSAVRAWMCKTAGCDISMLIYDFYASQQGRTTGDILSGLTGVSVEWTEVKQISDTERRACLKFSFKSGETVLFVVNESYDESAEVWHPASLNDPFEISWDSDLNLDDFDTLDTESGPYVQEGKEPHEDEWVRNLTSFMELPLHEQLPFFSTIAYPQILEEYAESAEDFEAEHNIVDGQ